MNALDTLKSIPQWVVYNSQKIPLNPHTGQSASSTNKDTWSDYDTAVQAVKRYPQAKGLGFVFTKEAGIVGVDLDDCILPDGTIDPTKQWIVDHLNSYTEFSPSGKGLHIFVFGQIPKALKRSQAGVEIYSYGRYFTVTGKHLTDTPTTIEKRQAQIMTILKTYDKGLNSEEKIRSMLSCIPAAGLDYDREWLIVLMAVHSEFPNQTGLNLVLQWTAHTSKPHEVESKWQSFQPGGGVTIGSLVHIARSYGWKEQTTTTALDTIHPPLTQSQKDQASKIIDRLVSERVWAQYRAFVKADKLHLPETIIDHFQIGYRPQEVDQSTGEITGSAVVVPFWTKEGTVKNVEYRVNENQGYEYYADYPIPFYCRPLWEHDTSVMSLVLPDSLSAVNTMLKHGAMTYKDQYVDIYGLPHVSMNRETVDAIGTENMTIIIPNGYNIKELLPFKDYARFLVIPKIELLTSIDTADLKRMIRYAETYQKVS